MQWQRQRSRADKKHLHLRHAQGIKCKERRRAKLRTNCGKESLACEQALKVKQEKKTLHDGSASNIIQKKTQSHKNASVQETCPQAHCNRKTAKKETKNKDCCAMITQSWVLAERKNECCSALKKERCDPIQRASKVSEVSKFPRCLWRKLRLGQQELKAKLHSFERRMTHSFTLLGELAELRINQAELLPRDRQANANVICMKRIK